MNSQRAQERIPALPIHKSSKNSMIGYPNEQKQKFSDSKNQNSQIDINLNVTGETGSRKSLMTYSKMANFIDQMTQQLQEIDQEFDDA